MVLYIIYMYIYIYIYIYTYILEREFHISSFPGTKRTPEILRSRLRKVDIIKIFLNK